MKINYLIAFLSILGMAAIGGCSDITDTQKAFLDRGETVYVGKLSSLVVYGGHKRVEVVGKNTYLRNAVKCVVQWENMEGVREEKIFNIEDVTEGENVRMSIAPLEEGDYDFYVYTMDEWGNHSLTVEGFGSSYGEKYIKRQSPISIIKLDAEDDGTTTLAFSQSRMAVKCIVNYTNTKGEPRSIEIAKENLGQELTLPDWENKNNAEFNVVTYVLPEDKLGLDILELPAHKQVAKQEARKYDVDKSKIKYMRLTEHDEDGKAYGAKGENAPFDGSAGGNGFEFWSEARSVPGHFCFDLGRKTLLTDVSYIGRFAFAGWNIVKFEMWGREDISDGPDGATGYRIMAKSVDESFKEEAVRRQWKKIGYGWFKYANPRTKDPDESQCALTEIDHSFRPRYIMFRVMSVIAPDQDADKYFGENGGFYIGDGVNDRDRAFCIGELSFKANGITYSLE